MMGTKPSWATLATFCGSVTPSNRRTATYIALAYLLYREGGTGRPYLKLTNMPSVKGYKGWHNFREHLRGEVRRIPIPRTRVNKGTQKAGTLIPRPSYSLPTKMLHFSFSGCRCFITVCAALGTLGRFDPVDIRLATAYNTLVRVAARIRCQRCGKHLPGSAVTFRSLDHEVVFVVGVVRPLQRDLRSSCCAPQRRR